MSRDEEIHVFISKSNLQIMFQNAMQIKKRSFCRNPITCY